LTLLYPSGRSCGTLNFTVLGERVRIATIGR
jgi:hypothetical protein